MELPGDVNAGIGLDGHVSRKVGSIEAEAAVKLAKSDFEESVRIARAVLEAKTLALQRHLPDRDVAVLNELQGAIIIGDAGAIEDGVAAIIKDPETLLRLADAIHKNLQDAGVQGINVFSRVTTSSDKSYTGSFHIVLSHGDTKLSPYTEIKLTTSCSKDGAPVASATFWNPGRFYNDTNMEDAVADLSEKILSAIRSANRGEN